MAMKKLALFSLLLNLAMFLAIVLAIVPKTTGEGYGGDDDDCGDLLGSDLYKDICPEAEAIIFARVRLAVFQDTRMAASLLRLHFHDCFVNGCDASVLLDDTDNFVGEKTAAPNLNSLRGFEVIDAIKQELEFVCPQTVSCADILATAARDSVVVAGGPSWDVQMGRKDSLTASKALANNIIPGPNSTIGNLVAKFQNVNLSLKDMVALSGAHTMGKARCTTFAARLQDSTNPNGPEASLEFIQSLQQLCSVSDSSTLANLDLATPEMFDNQYYVNLLSGEGLLPSDQNLVTGDEQTRELVETYAQDMSTFFQDFKDSMITLGRLGPFTGTKGEIRRNCRSVN
ncbi:PREDICTED: peroxidase [Prunus dulcis]|uniref:Peroxidase n=1 Tax=Prunus dulcis TaxID=3755 RepID=A0A5E4FQ40_PRUDU|nr:peroxidase 40 [Prunus dulcis]QCL12321.1 Peroxidase 40 protein [Prunus dulcis]QCL12322.1 Peroxidase 40 protein [Prunus dulcis]VVA29619.1 PREDICTED: peroxidase [Prunus dulcis]